MKANPELLITRLLLLAVLAGTVIISPMVLDWSLTPRFILFACLLLPPVFLLYRQRQQLLVQLDVVTLSYLAYTVFCVLSIAWSISRPDAVFESAKTVLGFITFSLTIFLLRGNKVFLTRKLLKLSVLVFFILLPVALYQFGKVPDNAKDALYTVSGLNGHKNLFASFLFLNLCFLLWAAVQLSKPWRMAALAAILATLAILFFLKTKAVWIGLLVSLAIMGLLYAYKKSNIHFKLNKYTAVVVLLVVNVFFLFLLEPITKHAIAYDAATPAAPTLDQERLILWDKTYQVFKQHPIAGVGMGNWQVHFPNATLSGLYRAEDLNFTFQRPHNDWLWILSETGLIGFNCYLLFLITLLLPLFKAVKHDTKRFLKGPAPLPAFIIGYFCIAFFDFPKERMEHVIWLNLMLGFGYAYVREQKAWPVLQRFSFSNMMYVPLMLLLAGIAYVGMLRHHGEYQTRRLLDHQPSDYATRIQAGEAALNFAYVLDPTSMPIYWYLGNARQLTGNVVRAHADFEKAYQHNPYNRNVLNDLGSSYAMLGDTASAIYFYKKAMRISPRYDDPKLNLTALYIGQKQFAKADSCLQTLMHDSERRSSYQKLVNAFK